MADLRASDADRELIVDGLRSHHAAGRIDDTELEERLAAALAARTRGELTALVRDLPPPEGAATLVRPEPGAVVVDAGPDTAWRMALEHVVPPLVEGGDFVVTEQHAPHWLALDREFRPWWVWLIVVFAFPFGLLALMIRQRERTVVSVSDAGGGRSRISVTGANADWALYGLVQLGGGR